MPQLSKVVDPVFCVSTDRDRYLSEKRKSLTSQKCFLEHEMLPEIYDYVCDFIKKNYPLSINGNFFEVLPQIQEDIAIHRLSQDGDWLAATHICLPSSWSPEEKIGKSFDQIHEIIPGMSLKNSRKLLEASIFRGPFERFVWGLIYEDELNYHPSLVRKPFDIENPFFMVKIERQIMWGLPQFNSLLFILRQFLIPESEVDKHSLYKSINSMTSEQMVYKKIQKEFLSYLKPV